MPDYDNQRDIAICLNLLPGFGPRAFRRLLDADDRLSMLTESRSRDSAVSWLPADAAAAWKKTDPVRDASLERRRAGEAGAFIITWFDEAYPQSLRAIHDPPPVLYAVGSLEALAAPPAAVVGCRGASDYGLAAAERIGRELAALGWNVVSGLADGIDTAAHRGALASGYTTAVLGSGIDITYPAGNRALRRRIEEKGLVLSEFPVGRPPEKYTFPRRNRVISGLSRAVIVVEAGRQSGALITADFALEQGKEVFAVPGQALSPTSEGCHQLLREGAHFLETAEDLLQVLGLSQKARPEAATEAPAESLSTAEADLLAMLDRQPLHVDEISRSSGMPPANVSALALSLELKGLIRRLPGPRLSRVRGGH